MTWYLGVLRKYAVFDGRARRKEYWQFTLVNTLVYVVLLVIEAATAGTTNSGQGILASAYSFLVLVPSLAVSVRRLHDTGRSGWWLLLAIVPFVSVALIIFFVEDGQQGRNRFGRSPKPVYAQRKNVLPAVPKVLAGWHADPTGRHQLRYWDGASWTHHASDTGANVLDPICQPRTDTVTGKTIRAVSKRRLS